MPLALGLRPDLVEQSDCCCGFGEAVTMRQVLQPSPWGPGSQFREGQLLLPTGTFRDVYLLEKQTTSWPHLWHFMNSGVSPVGACSPLSGGGAVASVAGH